MTPRTAYEASVARNPTRDDGTPRPAWGDLSDDIRRMWTPPDAFTDVPPGRFVAIGDGIEQELVRMDDGTMHYPGEPDETTDSEALMDAGYFEWR